MSDAGVSRDTDDAGFPTVDYRAWREEVEAGLQGTAFESRLISHTLEGLPVQPLYTRESWPPDDRRSGFPGLAPFRRGGSAITARDAGWHIRQEYAHPSAAVVNAMIAEDIARGGKHLWIRFDGATRRGMDPDDDGAARLVGTGGVPLSARNDFLALLAGVDLSHVDIVLDAGSAALAVAGAFIAHARGADLEPRALRGGFGCDPLGTLAVDGRLPGSLDRALTELTDLARWCLANAPGMRAVTVSSLPYHDAGGSAVDELGCAIATGTSYLRRLVAAGLDVNDAARQMLFVFAAARDLFMEIAKLRAARILWARVLDASGSGDGMPAMLMHVRASRRTKSVRDPWLNIVRAASETFAAIAGGADTISTPPFDEAIGPSDDLSRRLAWNTQVILQEESHLGRVRDPAGGSWYLETLTDDLARGAWKRFQAIEARGGMDTALAEGWIGREIAASAQTRRDAIARRREPIVGISEYPDPDQKPLVRSLSDPGELRREAIARVEEQRNRADARALLEALGRVSALVAGAGEGGSLVAAAVEAASAGATLGALATALRGQGHPLSIERLLGRRDAEPFEELRDAADACLSSTGRRPRVFLVGTSGDRARADHIERAFQTAGFEVQGGDAVAAFTRSGAEVAAIVGPGEEHRATVPALAPALRSAGARVVVLAAQPGPDEEIFRSSGVDHFVHRGCDLAGTLRAILDRLGDHR